MSRDEYYYRLGIVAEMMTKSDEYVHYPIACLKVFIEPAIRLEQIHIFLDRSGNPRGYLTWALLAEDAERRHLNDPEVQFHLSEWNEGDRLWIMDFLLVDGDVRTALQEARKLFPGFSRARSLRRRADGTVRKVVTWRRRR